MLPCNGMFIKRFFDIVISLFLLAVFALPMFIIAVAIILTSPGPVLYWSNRVGVNNSIFKMPKFRTMHMNTPAFATHLLQNAEQYVTSLGAFLRRLSLDELPQLFTILKGDMSFVGPRPALFNQDDLIALRTKRGAHVLIPGLTGWAQINGRDDLSIPDKVEYDAYYLQRRSLIFDCLILLKTLFKVIRGDGISH